VVGSIEFLSHSREETIQFAERFGKTLPEGAILCFFGDLAAGKTTFIKGLCRGFGDVPEDDVSSPTFVILNIYEGKKIIHHFDLYRLSGPEAFLSMGFDQYLGNEGIACIEWSEKIASILPKDVFQVTLDTLGEDLRRISIRSPANG
jgi:tRNA threonylcarbamoyladenosine biosynthesis protein TsaE